MGSVWLGWDPIRQRYVLTDLSLVISLGLHALGGPGGPPESDSLPASIQRGPLLGESE